MWTRVSNWFKRGSAAPARPAAPATSARPAPARPAPAKPAAKAATPAAPAHLPSEPKPAPRGKHLEYNPKLDGQADPGEIVWTYVVFEDDPNQGKDRPVLVVGRDGALLLGLMLSSESKRDGQHNWMALGSGDWDGQHRPSWLRLDRVLEVHEDAVRREGSILDRKHFDEVAHTLRTAYGWH